MATTKVYRLDLEGNAIGALREVNKEVKDLEKSLEKLKPGSAKAQEALRRMAELRPQVAELKAELNAITPEGKIQGFLDLARAVAGAMNIATVATRAFGLSGGEIDKYVERVAGLVAVLQSLAVLRELLAPERFAGLKIAFQNITALGDGFSLAAIKARFFGTTARAALVSTGIGALIVLIGTLIAYWDDVKAKATGFADAVGEKFPKATKFVEEHAGMIRYLTAVLTLGLSEAFRLYQRITADTLAEQKAANAKALVEQLDFEEKKRKAQLEAAGASQLALLALERDFATKQAAATLAAFKTAAKVAGDRSKLTEKERKELNELELKANQAAANKTKAEQAYTKTLADETAKRKADLEKDIDESLAADKERGINRAKVKGANEIQITTLELAAARQRVAATTQALKATDSADEDAFVRAKDRRLKAQAEEAELSRKLTKLLEAEAEKRAMAAARAQLLTSGVTFPANDNEVAIRELQRFDQAQQVAANNYADAQAEAAANVLLVNRKTWAQQAELAVDYYGKLRAYQNDSVFFEQQIAEIQKRLANERFAAFRQAVSDAVALAGQIGQTFAAEATAVLDGQISALDEQISRLQERQQAIDSQLAETTKRLADDEARLADATGNRRAALILRVEQERAAEAALRAEKAAAAKEEAKYAKERDAAEKRRQDIQAKADQANRIAQAVEATLAAISLIRTAAKSGEFAGPAAPFVIASTAAAGIAAALAIRNALKLESGGLLDGPSHAQGGIRGTGRFANIEVEGGEYVVNKRATAAHLPLLETINNGGLQYVPRPQSGRYAVGGQLPEPGFASGAATTATQSNAELIAEVRALRADVRAIPRPIIRIGEVEAEAISEQQASAAANRTATLLSS